jgi:hypothetical protein
MKIQTIRSAKPEPKMRTSMNLNVFPGYIRNIPSRKLLRTVTTATSLDFRNNLIDSSGVRNTTRLLGPGIRKTTWW